MASSRLPPHIDGEGRSDEHTAGRSGRPKMRQRKSSSSCTHGMPAGLLYGLINLNVMSQSR